MSRGTATISEVALADTLVAIARLMEEARNAWWVIGSAAVALHGADPGEVRDVDLLLGLDDAARILPAIGVPLRPGKAHDDFRSDIFGVWTSAPVPVEFMAGFSHRTVGGWQAVSPATRERIGIGGTAVYVPSRAELDAILRRFGRPKDIERADSLVALDF